MANGSVLIGPWPIVVIAAIHFTLYVYYKVRAFSENSYIFGQTPHVALILVRIALRVLGREQGKLYDSQPGQTAEAGTKVTENHDAGKCIGPSADEVVTIKNYRVSEDVLEKYKELFHEEDNATVPLCFPESLFMTSVLLLVSKPQFKLSPLGLIHTGQTIKQHEDLQILLEAPVTLEARTVEYRIVPKGVEVDIEMRVISALDQCVWSGVATLLSRSPQVQKSGSAPSTAGYQNSESDWDKQGK
ncbi:hypothetical protein BaRGS_00012938 [Batillaria attramentaria]|uniref:Uncharacterized protein n=1 Tax=Batillaria attramentaria TaxID=370345 RepID=A0ABD0L9M4_9CAEN